MEWLAQINLPAEMATAAQAIAIGGMGWILSKMYSNGERLARIEQAIRDIQGNCNRCHEHK